MLNSSRYLELYLAVGWAGAVIVPLNIRWSVAETAMLCKIAVLIFLLSTTCFWKLEMR